MISGAAEGASDRCSERREVALPLESGHDHRPELEVLSVIMINSLVYQRMGSLLHLVGVDDDVGGGVDGEEDVVDLDQDHHPGGVLLKPSVLHHLCHGSSSKHDH